jgi:ribose transport system ATP-binding protein
MEEFKLKLENITKTFPGVVALSNITFAIKEGEVRGLVGENGAGKSTLIKILTGAYKPDGGCIYINGIKFAELNPALSEQLGIAAVYQDLMLINHLTVQDNIFLGTELSKYSIIHKKKMYQKTREILSKMGYENIINPSDKVSNLRTALKGIVAIGKVLSKNVNTVILDEPTAVLSEREVKELFKIIKEMKSANLSVIYISHRLEEIFEICDSVTILKDGKLVATKMIPDVNEDSLIEMMVGRILNKSFYVARPAGQEILRVDRIETEKLKKCSFALK